MTNVISKSAPVYSCFDKGCLTTTQKRTRQCRLVLWVVIVWRYLVEVHGVLSWNERQLERECTNTSVCSASFSNPQIPRAPINQVQNHRFS